LDAGVQDVAEGRFVVQSGVQEFCVPENQTHEGHLQEKLYNTFYCSQNTKELLW